MRIWLIGKKSGLFSDEPVWLVRGIDLEHRDNAGLAGEVAHDLGLPQEALSCVALFRTRVPVLLVFQIPVAIVLVLDVAHLTRSSLHTLQDRPPTNRFAREEFGHQRDARICAWPVRPW